MFVVDPEASHDALHYLLLVGFIVDDELLGVSGGRQAWSRCRYAQGFDVAAQHPHTKRMEGGDHRLRHRQSAYQLFDALAHLCRSFVGESHRQDRLRHRAQILDQVGDAISDDPRLAAACPRKDEHRPFGSFNRFALSRIELVEKRQ